MNIPGIVKGASNLKGGDNPPFTPHDFKKLYPHFFESTRGNRLKPLVPLDVIKMYIELAHSSIKKSRYHEGWEMCMGLFVAHFVTMYMQASADPDGGTAAAAQAGQTKGFIASEAVDGVSVSYDFSQILSDLDGWAGWKATTYGVQLATLAKLYGMGGMYVP